MWLEQGEGGRFGLICPKEFPIMLYTHPPDGCNIFVNSRFWTIFVKSRFWTIFVKSRFWTIFVNSRFWIIIKDIRARLYEQKFRAWCLGYKLYFIFHKKMKLYLKKWFNKNPPKTIIYFIYLHSFPKYCYLPGKMIILYLQCLQMSFYLYNTNDILN